MRLSFPLSPALGLARSREAPQLLWNADLFPFLRLFVAAAAAAAAAAAILLALRRPANRRITSHVARKQELAHLTNSQGGPHRVVLYHGTVTAF